MALNSFVSTVNFSSARGPEHLGNLRRVVARYFEISLHGDGDALFPCTAQ